MVGRKVLIVSTLATALGLFQALPGHGLGSAAADRPALKTPAESTAYTGYTQNEAVAAFLSAAAAVSPEMRVMTVGLTRSVEGFDARDIYLVVLTAEGVSRPADLDRGRITVLITASQHGNEQSAKEAALRIIRDAALGDLKPLLKKINLLVMPQTNPYGNYFNIRENETGLDMNRDHIKLETEGVRAIHRVFRDWMPEMTIDVHEQGEDYYRISVGCVSNVNIDRGLQDYSRRVVLNDVEKALAKKDVTFHEYTVSEELGVDTSAGAAVDLNKGSGEMMLRHSTSDINDCRNSLGIFGTMSFIQEAASRHDIQTLEYRTDAQYQGLRSFLGSAAAHAADINGMVRSLRKGLAGKGAALDELDKVHMRMTYTRDPAAPQLIIKEFEENGPSVEGVIKVDKKAGETVLAGELGPYPGPVKARVVTRVVKNWFPSVAPTLSVVRPLGYIIPGARTDIVENLIGLGVEVFIVEADSPLRVEAYRVKDIKPAAGDYLAPDKLDVEVLEQGTVVRKGDFYVRCSQAAADLVPCLLEPQSAYGLIRYWKFRLVPETGGIFPIYRVVAGPGLRTVPYKNWGR